MRKYAIPGGAVAVMRDGKLSKPITAIAIMKLVEEGKLRPDDRATDARPVLVLPVTRAAW